MKKLFSSRKSTSAPLPDERPPRGETAVGTTTGSGVTNYRSFSEYRNHNHNRSNNSSGSNNSSNNASRGSGNHNDPISLIQSNESLLEDQRNLHNNQYRGFSTSMHDMYASPEYERVDCCAMACGGMLQSDRDRFLLQGITPPTIARRFWLHICFPCFLLALAASGAMRIADKTLNQIFCTGIVLVLICYIAAQCFKGRTKRTDIRKDLLWTKAQLQEDRTQSLAVLLEQSPPNDSGRDQEYYLGQTQRDFGCAHPCCCVGCYAEDRAAYELNFGSSCEGHDDNDGGNGQHQHNRTNNEQQVARDSRKRNANIAKCLWDYACPACWCGHQMMCCGICALAQEAREVESAVLPAAYRRVDYISMQPISHYYPAIYRKRHFLEAQAGNRRTNRQRQQQRGIDSVEDAALQQRVTGSSSNNQRNGSDNDDYVPPRFVLSNLSWQLLQFALTITGLVFLWCLIGKFFWRNALGLAVPEWRIFDWTDFIVFMAVWFQSFALTGIIVILCNRNCPTHLSLDAIIKYFAAGFCLSTTLAVFWELFLGMFTKAILALLMSVSGVDVVEDDEGYQLASSWFRYGAGSFARSVAGKTEADNFLRAFGNSHPIFYTLFLFFSAFFLAAFVEEVCKYFGYRMIEHPDFMTQAQIQEAMGVVIQAHDEDDDEDELDDEQIERRREATRRRQQYELENIDFSKQKKSMQALGGAITLAMVSTAMGFACCENLVYVFIYSGSSIGMEVSVLVARSLFPVHPIAAAIMSLRVIERDVEVTRTARLGKILAPSVIFHGAYDFFILWIDFMSQLNGNYLESTFDIAGFSSFVVSALVIAGGVVYYLFESSKQRSRLQVTDYSLESGQSVLV